jgi:hypothetical protein
MERTRDWATMRKPQTAFRRLRRLDRWRRARRPNVHRGLDCSVDYRLNLKQHRAPHARLIKSADRSGVGRAKQDGPRPKIDLS